MKISNLETAMKLAKITGRPLEDFYEAPTETINDQQEIEESVESEEQDCDLEIEDNIPEVQDNEDEQFRGVLPCISSEQSSLYHIKYGGRYSPNGVLVCHTKDMSHTEYKSITKKMTQKEILKSPLLYVLFRSEDQKEGHFFNWLDSFPKE